MASPLTLGPSEVCAPPPHLNVFIRKEVLYKGPVNSGHASMMNGKSIGQEILQLQVLWERKRTGDEVSLPVELYQTQSKPLHRKPHPLSLPHNQT